VGKGGIFSLTPKKRGKKGPEPLREKWSKKEISNVQLIETELEARRKVCH